MSYVLHRPGAAVLRRGWPGILGVALALTACTSTPLEPAATGAAPPAAESGAHGGGPSATGMATIERARSRWVPVDWPELPGWDSDRTADLWVALLRGCERPLTDWARVCSEARRGAPPSDAETRLWLQRRLQPYRIESRDGGNDGLVTGYFEPLVDAARAPNATYRVPLYATPPDLATRRPYWTRRQIDTDPAARAGLRGRELAWVADPMDALILQIQGSGRLALTEPDGNRRLVRVAFAGHNDQPYKSVGRWLIDQGELRADQASWPAIKAWAQRNPKRLNELLWANPRYVFFREEPLPDPALGPRGAQGVALTPGRSVAVDPQSIPYGTPLWLDTTEPLTSTPLRRAVMAQDTGSAIVGAVRADYFWGWGAEAEQQAGRMKQPLRLWALWPK